MYLIATPEVPEQSYLWALVSKSPEKRPILKAHLPVLDERVTSSTTLNC